MTAAGASAGGALARITFTNKRPAFEGGVHLVLELVFPL